MRGCFFKGWAGEVWDGVDGEVYVVGRGGCCFVVFAGLVSWRALVAELGRWKGYSLRYEIFLLILTCRGELLQSVGVDALDALPDWAVGGSGERAGGV